MPSLNSSLATGDISRAEVSTDKPIVIETDDLMSLCFDDQGLQSCMLRMDPNALALGYTRTMMGFLLFQPEPSHIGMIGLGGGSLVKYCYKRLPSSRMTVAEINADVIALRERFHIPADDDRLTVVCMDGDRLVSTETYGFDVLIVDGFDANGLPAELGHRAFYENCHDRLHDDGILAANFLTDDPRLGNYLTWLRDAFGGSVALAPAEESANNIIAFAWKSDAPLPSLETLIERAACLTDRHDVDLAAAAMRIEIGTSYDWKHFGASVAV